MINKSYLIRPTAVFKDSYLEALREGYTEGTRKPLKPDEIATIEASFDAYLHGLDKNSHSEAELKGRRIPCVPSVAFWLVEEKDFMGSVSIRSRIDTEVLSTLGGHIGYGIRPAKRKKGYGKHLLSLALDVARGMGIGIARISCAEANHGSRAIIEANGGIFLRKHPATWYIDNPFLIFEISLVKP